MPADDDDLCVPLPCLDSDEDEPQTHPLDPPTSRTVLMEALLRSLAEGSVPAAGLSCAAAQLQDLDFWRSLADEEDLHVLSSLWPDRDHPATTSIPAGNTAEHVASLRHSLDVRGYLPPMSPVYTDAAALAALCRMCRRLRSLGFAPVWIFIFDEAWHVLSASWSLMAAVLSVPPEGLVLEPSMFAHALSRPQKPSTASEEHTSLARYSYVGGNFGIPHRDHSSTDCFGASGDPTLLSVWVPLNSVTLDNGAMLVLPKEFDPLLHQPDHPHHLLPFDQHSRRAHFELGAAVALAPCPGGAPLAWHGSLIHWGGACSAYTDADPRISLTAALRVAGTPGTMLKDKLALRRDLTYGDLPSLSLTDRIGYIAGSLLIYQWWFGLEVGVLPPDIMATLEAHGLEEVS